MFLNSLRLVNFRSYADESFEFNEGVNIIVGPNASGKTNLLEAVLVLSRGKSYRVTDKDLIKHEQEWLRLEGIYDDDHPRVLKVTNKPDKEFNINGKAYKRLPAALKAPIILFEPNHLLLLHGQPEARRNFLDDILEATLPEFSAARRHYKRVLQQRNSLLKNPTRSLSQHIFVWDVRLSELGGYIATSRQKLIEDINKNISEIYSGVAGKKTQVETRYVSNIVGATYESTLLKKLQSSLDDDTRKGFTSNGPHRDDFEVYINDKLVAENASRGETRTALLSLKIYEIKIVEEKNDSKPIVLLDDVFSELDGSRRHALTSFIKDYQTFITTTDADVVGHGFAQKANLIAL